MARHDERSEQEKQTLTPEEISQIRTALPYIPDLIEVAASRRTAYSLLRAVKTFCMWFIGLSALAITFKQSVLDVVNFIRSFSK